MVTTIYESNTQVVTATEIKTNAILVTPEPTWKIETVTITPTMSAHKSHEIFESEPVSSRSKREAIKPSEMLKIENTRTSAAVTYNEIEAYEIVLKKS